VVVVVVVVVMVTAARPGEVGKHSTHINI